MAGLNLRVEVDANAADRWKKILGEGSRDAVDQLSVLAEGAMKEEAPEGVGIPDVNMQTTIKPKVEGRDPYRKSIAPRKKTEEGWPLHHAIIEGTSYNSERPPIDPLKQWAAAKLGNPDLAWYIQDQIFQDGHETFPNPFVDRSVKKWENRAEEVAQDAVDEAFDTGGAG